MATLATGGITSSNTGFFSQHYSKKLVYEGIIKNPVMKLFMENGIINREDSLEKEGGGTVTMFNALRGNSIGFQGDIDIYSSAALLEKSTRTLNVLKNSYPITWPMRGTQTQQFASFDIGSANEQVLTDWTSAIMTGSLLNQAGSNTATSVSQFSAADGAGSFTGGDLTTITGNNATSVPTYHYWGSSPGTAKTTDASIGSTDVLTLKDFEFAAEIITSQQTGKPTWQILQGKKFLAVAIISQTGLNQLINEAVTAQQGMQLSQVLNANLAGGKEMDLQQFMLPGIPFLFAVVPDSWLPRGVTLSSGAETANSRRAIIVGRNCIDLSFGKGFAPEGGQVIPGMSVKMDTNHKKLNNAGYAVAELLWGCKKAQQTGVGSGNSTAYDISTFVIAHYSRT